MTRADLVLRLRAALRGKIGYDAEFGKRLSFVKVCDSRAEQSPTILSPFMAAFSQFTRKKYGGKTTSSPKVLTTCDSNDIVC